jgi:hypothetical protein
MTNEELTLELLDKLGWDYDKELNPNRYKNTKPVYAGELILAIFNHTTVTEAAKNMGFSYKVVMTAAQNFLKPIFGPCNGGNDTWKFKFQHFLQKKECGICNNLLDYSEFCVDNSNTRGIKHSCKKCISVYQKNHHITYSESYSKTQEKYKDKIYARNAQYRAERKLRLPSWSEEKEIEEFYANCPPGMHVDHMLPLKGELVSGLHVLANLQYLTEKENLEKGNRINLEEYNEIYYST